MVKTVLKPPGLYTNSFTVIQASTRTTDSQKQNHLGSSTVYNPYPNFKYSGKLRPFPLSETRLVPASIMRPDYAETGIPKSEYEMKRSNGIVKPLLSETIEKMRHVCKVTT